MTQRSATVASAVGLHARPAALFVKAATSTGLPVTICRQGQDPVDARSILAVMAMGAKCGEEVVLSVDGDGAEQALDGLARLIEQELDGE